MMRRWLRSLTVRGRDEGGSILPLTAVIVIVLFAVGAVAVDVGRLAASSRDLQGVTDRAALDAILAMSEAVDAAGAANAAVHSSLAHNPGLSGSGTAAPWEIHQVETGRFESDGTFTADPSSRDGVRVVLDSSVNSLFIPGTSDLRREAIARQDTIASVAAGTTTARLEGGALNDVLSALLNTNVDLDVVGWQGIADTNVRLGALAAELGVGTTEELLATSLTINRLLDVMIDAIERDGGTATIGLQQLVATLPALPEIQLGDLLALSGGDPALGADVNALDLLMGAVQVANVDNAVAVDLAVPGVTSVELTVVEPPVLAAGRAIRGPDNEWVTRASASQTALDIELPLTGDLDVDLGALLEVDLLDDLRVRVETGSGEVALTSAVCGDPGQLGVDTATAGASVALDAFNVADMRLLGLFGLVDLATIEVSVGAVEVPIATATDKLTLPGPFATDPQTVGAAGLDLADALASALTSEIHVDVEVLGILPLPLGGLISAVTSAVAGLLADVLAPLDAVVGDLLGTIGVQAGVMDVWGVDLDCSGRYLAR